MNRALCACLLAVGIGGAELSIQPERVIIDARQAAPAAVTVALGATGKASLVVKAEIVDALAAHAPPGVKLGQPNFPFSIALSEPQVVPGTAGKLTVAFAPEAGAYALRAWQMSTQIVRLRTNEVGAPAYDIPVTVRFHAPPAVEPAQPVATRAGTGWSLAFTLRTGDPDERIAQIALEGMHQAGLSGGAKAKAATVTGVLASAADGSCTITTESAPEGWIAAELAITYDRPAPARKLLTLRCRFGEAKESTPAGPKTGSPAAEPAPEPQPRRVRIN